MRKTLFMIIGSLFFACSVYAAGTPLYAQIEAPKSPTNQTDMSINVVVLDRDQAPSITVQCFWRKNGGAWNALGNAITVTPGGNNTANCQTGSNQINEDGTYDFFASVVDGTYNVYTQTVSVAYTRSGPGTPTNYSKEKPTNCSYKISFHTADDSGKTTKVEVYRSTNTTFSADGGTRIGTVTIGSNLDGSYTDTVSDCNTTYYYAIRAFDGAGNGSGVVGDSQTVTIYTTPTPAAGAIPAGTGGNVLGAAQGALEGATGASGAVLGEEATPSSETPTLTPTPTSGPQTSVFTGKNIGIGGGILVLLIILFLLFK